jgi:two-component system sensor histidine kinase KdpD
MLATIADEADRMGRFVGNLLDMTRLESGAVVKRPDQIDLGELIGSALARAAKVLAHHTVTLDLALDLPLLPLDGMLLEQVLFNLLDNAAKYAPQETVITLRGWWDRKAREVLLQVIDEGPGVPPELYEKIFEKFYRVHARDHARAGTGLGLAICRGFVEAMGGRISVSNRADRSGAVFTLRFPAPGGGAP